MEPVDCIIRCILFLETIPSLMFFSKFSDCKTVSWQTYLKPETPSDGCVIVSRSLLFEEKRVKQECLF